MKGFNSINEETIDLRDLYRDLPDENKVLIAPLLDSLAFIKTQLDLVQKEIEENGVIDVYQNGNNQKGYKQSASVQAYCNLLKSYSTIYSKVSKMIPLIKRRTGYKLEKMLEELGDD